MAARSASRLAALFVALAVVVALVVYLAFGLGGASDAKPRIDPASLAAEDATAQPAHADAPLAEAGAKNAAARVVAPVVHARPAATGPTDAELADAWWVHGRVTFPDGTPADERATVVAQGREFGSKTVHRVPVAPDGTFRVAFSKRTTRGTLRLDARYVYLPQVETVKPTDPDKQVLLATALGGGLKGRVVPSAAAQPFVADLVGATVTATGWKNGMSGPRAISATVGEHLEFELGGLDPDMQWGVTCAPKGFAATYAQRPVLARGKLEPFDLAIQRGGRISGTVRDAAGAPIEGAQLETDVRSFDGMGLPGLIASDKEGRFTLEGVRAGKIRVNARKPSYVIAHLDAIEVADGGARTDLAVVLQHGNLVAGVVTWPDGKPAAGAHVEVQEPPDENGPHFYGFGTETPDAKTDGEGAFTITGLGAGPYTVIARSAPKEVEGADAKSGRKRKVNFQAQVDDVAANTRSLSVVLASGTALRGRVHDDLGAVVEAFTVKVDPVREEGESWRLRDDISRDVDDRGGEFNVLGVTEGEWKVHVETKDGSKSESVDLTLPRDDKVLDLVLVRGATLRGVVLDAAGVAVKGARIEVQVSGAERTWDSRPPEKSRITGDDGTFSTSVPAGLLEVHASYDGFADSTIERIPVSPAQAAGPLTLSLRRGATLVGEVRDKSGKIDGGRTVSVAARGVHRSVQATTDAAGKFRLEHVTPGETWISLQPTRAEIEASMTADGTYTMRSGNVFNSEVEKTVADGETVEVMLGGLPKDPVRVFGVVRAEQPLEGVVVSLSRRGEQGSLAHQTSATTDADGRYDLTVSGAGEYMASFGSRHGGAANKNCTIPPGASFELDVTLPSGSLSGHVVTDEGKPMANVQVQARLTSASQPAPDELQTGFGYASSAADGTFTIAELPPGEYQLTAEPQRWEQTAKSKSRGSAQKSDIHLDAGGKVAGIELRIPRAGSVHGVVTDANGPVAGANVTVSGAGAELFGHDDTTDASGRYQIDGLNPGTVMLVACSDAQASRRSEAVTIRADEDTEANLRLEPAGKIHIVVQDASGKSVQKPWNVLDDHGRDCRNYPMDWTEGGGADGGWTIGPIPAGSYTVRVVTAHAGEESETRIDKQVDLAGGAIENVVVQVP